MIPKPLKVMARGSVCFSNAFVCRACAVCFWLAAAGVAVSGVAEEAPARVASRFRLGPFYERRVMEDGSTFTAVRPFYSRSTDAVARESVTDSLWPLATFHRSDDQSWWRVLVAFGDDLGIQNPDAGWTVGVFPLWLQGRSRLGEDYWALFPLYGHIPHFWLMEDLSFVLFPLYLRYEVAAREREYYLWPVVSRLEEREDERRTSVWPFYGYKDTPREETRYVLWPFWVDTVYKDVDKYSNPGSAWMLFPIAGQVAREHEQQWLAVPPFISHALTPKADRWRVPWPFVQWQTAGDERSHTFWPFYSDRLSEDTRYFSGGWFLFSREKSRLPNGRVERMRIFPFYVNESTYAVGKDGAEYERENYLRVWPLFSRVRTPGASRFRTLDLSPVRHVGGLDRNWAPFWTLYERSSLESEVEHDALWGIINFRLSAEREEGGR